MRASHSQPHIYWFSKPAAWLSQQDFLQEPQMVLEKQHGQVHLQGIEYPVGQPLCNRGQQEVLLILFVSMTQSMASKRCLSSEIDRGSDVGIPSYCPHPLGDPQAELVTRPRWFSLCQLDQDGASSRTPQSESLTSHIPSSTDITSWSSCASSAEQTIPHSVVGA